MLTLRLWLALTKLKCCAFMYLSTVSSVALLKLICSFLITTEECRFLLCSQVLSRAYPFFEDARYCWHMFQVWQADKAHEEERFELDYCTEASPDTD